MQKSRAKVTFGAVMVQGCGTLKIDGKEKVSLKPENVAAVDVPSEHPLNQIRICFGVSRDYRYFQLRFEYRIVSPLLARSTGAYLASAQAHTPTSG